MTVLKSNINLQSEEFKANKKAMTSLLQDLQHLSETYAEGGSERARERHTQHGKLLPRERIQTLLDPGAPFLELSPLAGHKLYDEAVPGGGIITGIGRIANQECMILCNDPTVKGGTYY